ncbi:MAG: DNA methylase N-4 [Caulobacter sp.]|nr:DNA methylase N-4 [Caulobacter sp.]
MTSDPYLDFLQTKVRMAEASGFAVALEDINPCLKDHARVAVRWALAGGRRAIFANFGLGKTSMQLELMARCIAEARRRGLVGRGLIVAPLGVMQEFRRDAEKIMGWGSGEGGGEGGGGPDAPGLPRFIRATAEAAAPGVYLTNYESVREGLVDPAHFDAASLDEADVLRSFGSKTYQTFLPLFEAVPWRFVATATPSPNRYKELIHYVGYLGVMDTGQALTRFFQRDSEKAGNLTLYPHKEHEFWLWVASWALFIQRPSDLGCSDEGYDLPRMTVNWHEVPVDHSTAGEAKGGQGLLFREAGMGVVGASREKRATLAARIGKAVEIVRAEPDEHRILWHDLEDERLALEQVFDRDGVVSIYGSQDLEAREQAIVLFSDGWFKFLAAKPVIAGAGCNFQRHCARAVFLGVGFKFRDFIQAIHRIQRFGQGRDVVIDVIFAESEREVRRLLINKWKQHDQMVARMSQIIQQYGLSAAAMAQTLARSIGCGRVEAAGRSFLLANNDCVAETRGMADDSVDLIVTSIPFSNQYEYTPSYNDFGHTSDNGEFWAQMGHLIPELLRILKPGRIACIHVKDRMLPGAKTGAGCYTVEPFHMEATDHFRRHGFLYMGMRDITTDVVRENNQTYRLSYGRALTDMTVMGSGSSEFVLQFRKPQTDLSRQWADERVAHDRPDYVDKEGVPTPWDRDRDRAGALRAVPGTGYSLARWQLDAHAYWRSDGNRLATAAEIAALPLETAMAVVKAAWLEQVYDHELNVAIGEAFAARGMLPMEFMAFPPPSWAEGVWSDINRMRTLNSAQAAGGREKHVCPLQFDTVERCIRLYSNPGELVFDPFGGLGTVPYCALKLGRRGRAVELNVDYWRDSVRYLSAMELEVGAPTLFDVMTAEEAA